MDNFLSLGVCLIVAGLLLMVAELFAFSGGLWSALALASLAVGLALVFWHDRTVGFFALLAVILALPLGGSMLLHWWPKTAIGKRFFLTEGSEDATVAALSANQELEQLKGRFGRTLSSLRPAGVVDFDGRRVDTITEGMMVDPGQWVRCIDVRAGKVVVRPVERPNLEREV